MQDDSGQIDVAGVISITHYAEIRAWCKELSCTELDLAEAVAVAGYSSEKVRSYLAARSLPSAAAPPFKWGTAHTPRQR